MYHQTTIMSQKHNFQIIVDSMVHRVVVPWAKLLSNNPEMVNNRLDSDSYKSHRVRRHFGIAFSNTMLALDSSSSSSSSTVVNTTTTTTSVSVWNNNLQIYNDRTELTVNGNELFLNELFAITGHDDSVQMREPSDRCCCSSTCCDDDDKGGR